ncbi:porin [Burkholderia dolosa]|jgi:predicted porin|uniref:porin n=1 Tax=Burkholderia dolosa TaxID=152500 RepID=UPI001B9F71F2|nr:porin [Burkholderia dolosa]MBR8316404.1 porin [Burkholderia dolosa]MBY4829125.1 porin [Burkholderia dolosa]
MKTAVCTAAAVCALAAPLAACAQSSVTLYGIIDTGIAWTNTVASSIRAPGASRWSMATGWGSGDRVGLLGREDLGGGLSAVFQLEMGFSGLNGTSSQGGRLFGRQAYVGLSSTRYGKLTLGRQYDYTFDYVAPLMSWLMFGSIYGAHIGDVDDSFQTFRLNNSVKYEVSPVAGLKLGALYAFSNQAGGDAGRGFANNRAYGFGLDYLRGPLHVVASYLQLNDPSAGLASANNPGGAIGDEYSGSTSIFYNAGFVERQRITALGAGYSFGAASVNFVFTNTLLDYRGGGSLRINNYEINGRYYFTPVLMAGVGYIFTDGHGYTGSGATSFAAGDRPRWHQVDAGIAYLLSKRTDLHMSMVYQRLAGDASTVAINFFGPAGAGRSSQIAVLAGLRHRF